MPPKKTTAPDVASTFMAKRGLAKGPKPDVASASTAKRGPAKGPKPDAPPITPSAYMEKATTLTAPRVVPGTSAPKLATLTAWSYSVYTQYFKCPLSVCFDKIKRVRMVEPPNPAFEKGNRVHGAAEQYIKSAGAKRAPALIAELAGVKDRLDMFRKLGASAELEWTFNKDWQPTSWFGHDAWLRVKTDACAESPGLVQITDWKTGKIYDDHKQQRSLYGMAGLQLVELGKLAGGDKSVKVLAEHAYTDTGQSATEEYSMKDLKPLKAEWLRRIKQMMGDTKYPAKTGFHCRYCKFRKSNGGPCPEAM